jgi:branched-chain amino acid transport system ATP-binding protein
VEINPMLAVSGSREKKLAGCLHTRYADWVFPGHIRFLNRLPISYAEVESDIDKLLEMVGLTTKQDLLCNQLMVVALKKVELARALASNPSLVLLDEVAAGSTEKELPQIAEVIKIMREMGKTVIMVEHIIKLMVNVVDRIIVMDKGRKIAEGSPEEVMKDADVIKAYLG